MRTKLFSLVVAVSAVLALVIAVGAYSYWVPAPKERAAPTQAAAIRCQDAIEKWQKIHADQKNAGTRTASDTLKDAESCSYTASSDDRAFVTQR